jgi:hypothetical protein
MEGAPPLRPWLGAFVERDPQFGGSYLATRERIVKDGAIPAKCKLLTATLTDAVAAHPAGVTALADDDVRAAGASEAEITEAAEVGHLFGSTAAPVMAVNAVESRRARMNGSLVLQGVKQIGNHGHRAPSLPATAA